MLKQITHAVAIGLVVLLRGRHVSRSSHRS